MLSYLKAHFSFSSGVPALVTSMAKRNSLKSMKPFLSVSKVRKTWSQNCSAFPEGKNILYMSTNLTVFEMSARYDQHSLFNYYLADLSNTTFLPQYQYPIFPKRP